MFLKMKSITYQITVAIVCVFAIIYIPNKVVQSFIILFSIVHVISLLKNIYIFLFEPSRQRFRRYCRDAEYNLFVYKIWWPINDDLDKFKKISSDVVKYNLKYEEKRKKAGIFYT